MRPQKHITSTPVKKDVLVVNEKVERMVKDANELIRVVVYLETAGMENARIYHFIKTLNEAYKDSHGTHYVVPVKNGKLNTDIQFEQEFLSTVRDLCTVDSNGQIVFKESYGDVLVIRERA
jgi:3,4-dihydroxy-2-butanone 4-phosphate synthase